MLSLTVPGSTCLHIQSELLEGPDPEPLKRRYREVLRWNVNRTQTLREVRANGAKKRRLAAPSCGSCALALSRPIACLNCPYAGCWKDGHGLSHVRNGYASGGPCMFSCDTKSGRIFCAQCDDFIYDATMDAILREAVDSAWEGWGRFQVSQRLREPYKPWTPDERHAKAMSGEGGGGFEVVGCGARRGLVNLGQTCFLNVVLQCLVGCPLVRGFFMADKHNWRTCTKPEATCTSCEMDRLVAEIFCPSSSSSTSTSGLNPSGILLNGTANGAGVPPHAPTSFLHTLYTTSKELGSYAQHDAHEAFISVLGGVHGSLRGSTNVSCNCLVHQVFGGALQSEIRCTGCGNASTTTDPILDISLTLGGGGPLGGNYDGCETLAGCLRRFVQPERLGAKEWNCGRCKGHPEASKRMSLKTLPNVLAFQIKRFEQKLSNSGSSSASAVLGGSNGTAPTLRKLDTHVRIPASLNMAPYTAAVVGMAEREGYGAAYSPDGAPSANGAHGGEVQGKEGGGLYGGGESWAVRAAKAWHGERWGARPGAGPPDTSLVGCGEPGSVFVPYAYPGPELMYEYDLFAVINHEGALDNGHYTCFAREGDEWYKYDDDKVSSASLSQVLNSNPYMCFYVKRHLEYKPVTVPTYVLREMEERKEKEREDREREKLGLDGSSAPRTGLVGAESLPSFSLSAPSAHAAAGLPPKPEVPPIPVKRGPGRPRKGEERAKPAATFKSANPALHPSLANVKKPKGSAGAKPNANANAGGGPSLYAGKGAVGMGMGMGAAKGVGAVGSGSGMSAKGVMSMGMGAKSTFSATATATSMTTATGMGMAGQGLGHAHAHLYASHSTSHSHLSMSMGGPMEVEEGEEGEEVEEGEEEERGGDDDIDDELLAIM